MSKTTITILATLCLLCWGMPAAASYRCEAGGKFTYGDTPCTTGAGKNLATPPSPRAEDVRTAQQRAQREAQALAQLGEQQRAAEERALRADRQQTRLAATNRKKCDALALQKKWRDEDAARAPVKSADKRKQAARRVDDRYSMRCKH